MKKVTYLLTIMFAVALLSTSCCKDDPIVPDGTLTKAEILSGEWVSVSYNYVDCGACNTGEVTDITLSEDMGSYDFELIDNCDASNTNIWGCYVTLLNEGTQLKLTATGFSLEFDVLDYDGENDTLVLELTFSNIDNPSAIDVPVGGIYTLEKL